MLLNKIQDDYKIVWKNKDKEATSAYRFIIGELQQRMDTKTPSDDACIAYMKKLYKSFGDDGVLESQNKVLLNVLKLYIPEEIPEETIITWISNNVDFQNMSNKMQAMEQIMSHFGQSIDGNKVKKILDTHF